MRFLILISVLFFTSCSVDNQNDTFTDVSISFGQSIATGAISTAIPNSIQSVSVVALNSARKVIAGPIVANRPNFALKIHVPNGNNIRFRILAFSQANAKGTILYETLSKPVNLQGKPVTVSVKMNLSVAVTASATSISLGATIDLYGTVARHTPPTTSPLLWQASNNAGLGTPSTNGGHITWTAPITPGTYTISAHINPSINSDQDPNVKGSVQITVLNNIPAPKVGVTSPIAFATIDIYGYALIGSNVDIYLDGNMIATVQPVSSLSSPSPAIGIFTYQYQLSNTPNGSHSITARARIGTNTSPLSKSTAILVNVLIQRASTSTIAMPASPTSIATTDLNGDSYSDIIVGDSTGNVQVYLGDGTGNVATTPSSVITNTLAAGMHQFAVGDVNNDTYTDIVLPSATNNTVTILTGSAAGTFTTQAPLAVDAYAAPFSVAITDINQDGYTDILTANNGSAAGLGTGNTVSILNGSPQGFVLGIPTTFTAQTGLSAITTTDFNLDSYTDAAIAGSSIAVAINNLAATPVISNHTAATPTHITTGYLSNYSYPEIVACNSNNSITVLFNGANGFAPPSNYYLPAGSIPQWAAIGDLNNDFSNDIVVAISGTTNAIAIFLNDGTGRFPSQPIIYPVPSSPSSIALDYIDNDFKLDIVLAYGVPKTISVFLNTGLTGPLQ